MNITQTSELIPLLVYGQTINIIKDKNMKRIIAENKKAYIALISILIVGAVALNIAVSSAILSVGQGRNGLLAQNLTEAKGLANACAEKALMDLKDNVDYVGNETVSLGSGQCQIETIENLGGETRLVKVTGRANQITKKIKININQINPTVTITSWLEVDNF